MYQNRQLPVKISIEEFIGSEKMPSSCIDFGTNQNDVEQIVTTTNVLKKTKKIQTIKPRQCNKTTQTYLDASSTFFASSTPIRPHTHDNSIIGECIDTNTSVQDANNQDDSNGECILDTSIQDDVNINNHYAGDSILEDHCQLPIVEDNEECDRGIEDEAVASISRYSKVGDPDFQLSTSDVEGSDDSEVDEQEKYIAQQDLIRGKPASEQIKFVVFEEALLNAFDICRLCGSACTVKLEHQIGSFCSIQVCCPSDSAHDFTWSTGPILNHMPVFHLLFASGILCNGLETSKVLRLFDSLKIINLHQREFSNILKVYAILAVFQIWQKEQKARIEAIKGKSVTIASDMRVDSPGHSGLIGSGNTMGMLKQMLSLTHKL